jgi:hypothetical protein
VASYKGVNGVLVALEEFFKSRLPPDLGSEPVNARVALLGSADVAQPITGNVLGIYLHRLTVDPHGRSRSFPARGSDLTGPVPELPVNLHFLIIAAAGSATIEADLMSWAMVVLANEGQLDISHIAGIDSEWGERELLNIIPEEMSTEDLMRIWDVFETAYTATVPYVARTVRLRLNQSESQGPAVVTRVFHGGTTQWRP